MRQLTFCARLTLSLLLFGCLVPCPAGAQAVSVLMQHYNTSRTGFNASETTLNTSNVNVNQFGKLFTRTVDGQIYAQPLYVPSVTIAGTTQNVVYVATMHNSVYAFDADDPNASAPLWQVNLGTSVASTCDDTQPEYGVLSTPAIDTSTNTIYAVARTTESDSSIAYRLHALDITTGAEKPNSPVVIQASVPGNGTGSVNGTITFDPTLQLNRPGLLLTGGNVYLAFGSQCDGGNYHGWLMSYNATTLVQTGVFSTTPNGGHGGVWQTGNGPALDSSGNICLITGDGSFDANQPGGFDYGDTFMKFSPALSVLDWFTPDNYAILQQQNLDLGTGGPLLLPGTTYMAGGSKQGVIYVVDTTNMGHVNASNNSEIVQSFQATNGGEIVAAPIFWSGSNGQFLYVWGQGDPLKQFQFTGGLFGTTPVATSAAVDPGDPSGGEPLTVSSNGTTSGTGIVWATGAVNLTTNPRPGILRAYDATNVGAELWDSYQNQSRDDFGSFAKFAAPTVTNGKVYVATFSNQLVVYGLLSNLSGPTVTAESPIVGSTGVAVSTTVTATFSTAMKASTISTSTFTLTPSGGSPITATVAYNSTTDVATLTPSATLANNITYTAAVLGGSGGVTDSSGNPMASSFTWTFTTVGTASTPTVTNNTPAGGATGVPATVSVTATFSTAMNASTITTSTFTLAPSGGNPVAATISYNATTHVATLTPSASLANNIAYTATVVGGSRGVKSSLGTAMTSSFTWTFTTDPSGSSAIPTTGLGVWFKADSGITLNGSTVSQWADQSGNGNNAAQPVVGAQPTVVSSAINGLPAVNFGGTADMQFNLPVNGLTGMTIFLVNANGASFTGGSGDVSNAPLFWDETADWGTVYLSPFEQSVKWAFGTGQINNMPSYTRTASIGTAFTMTDVVKNGTTEDLYVGGTLVATQTGVLATIANTLSTGNLGVGYLSTHWNGQIAEVIVYTVALSDAQRQQVEQYLTSRYFPNGSTAPTVTAQSPANGATGVGVSTAVTATFSTAMNASTVTNSTFTLTPSGGSPVAGAVSYNATTNVATLTPSAALTKNTTYTATVVGGSGGVTDVSGNPLGSSVTWSFTTAAITAVRGDFDGNGVPDLVWQNDTTRQVTVNYYGGPQGASLIGWNWLNPSGAPGWHVVAVADFDGNGVPDLVWQNDTTRQVTVNYYGGPKGATLIGWNWLNSNVQPGWHVVAAADFDGNGTPDLVWQNDTTRQVTVNYYGGAQGATMIGWKWLNSSVQPGWHVVAAADFDGNGVPDLVWQNDTTRQVTVNYYGGAQGAAMIGWKWLNSNVQPGWSVVGAADFDGNGVPDLIWQNNTTRQVTVNYYGGAQGATMIGWKWLNSSVQPGWTAILR